METTIVYGVYIGIMENKMEATISGLGSIQLQAFKVLAYRGLECEIPSPRPLNPK